MGVPAPAEPGQRRHQCYTDQRQRDRRHLQEYRRQVVGQTWVAVDHLAIEKDRILVHRIHVKESPIHHPTHHVEWFNPHRRPEQDRDHARYATPDQQHVDQPSQPASPPLPPSPFLSARPQRRQPVRTHQQDGIGNEEERGALGQECQPCKRAAQGQIRPLGPIEVGEQEQDAHEHERRQQSVQVKHLAVGNVKGVQSQQETAGERDLLASDAPEQDVGQGDAQRDDESQRDHARRDRVVYRPGLGRLNA